MGFEYKGPPIDPSTQKRTHPEEQPTDGRQPGQTARYEEPKYREHVSQPLVHRTGSTPAQPVYVPQGLQGSQGTPGTYPPVAGQPPMVRPVYPPIAPQYQQPYNPTYPPGQVWRQPYPGQMGQQHPGQPYPGQMGQQHPGQPYPVQYAQPYSGQPYGYPVQGGYGYPYSNGYYPYTPYGYYGGYGYYGQSLKPKRDVYQLTISIISIICSSIVLATGLLCALFLLITALVAPYTQATTTKPGQLFSSITMLTALTIAGLVGGSFGLYHSIMAVRQRKSIEFKLPSIPLGKLRLPWFVLFLAFYVVMIAIGLMLRGNDHVAQQTWLTVFLIALAGMLPALAILSLGVWRVHNKQDEHWTTTWRRLSIAMISGATSAILFASIFELILSAILVSSMHINSFNMSDPNMPIPNDSKTLIYLFLVVSVVAPLVEEGVKPLAVVTLVGRIHSAAEAFLLGMACGIGFDLIETSGYISSGYSNWVDVAIQRSSAGLLHSFGAGMTALGWYLLTHKDALPKRRIWIGLGCGLYAVLQHAIWNGSFIFQILPAPIGPYFTNGTFWIGNYELPSIMFIYIVETILMVCFFLFVTGKLGRKPTFWRRRPANVSDTATSQPTNPPSNTHPLPVH
ncbi:PrsW family intramembrane metalloprotease [Dictyobacter arantiisoli]|uniref:Protease PrsW n=1 Tax=Dictyobacter arantiisoli TaxID=2014874 RepID=A0A5A5T5V2_9CHLR|nr:PrsW family glutamic-type intramembrane protease [Dictyobacter arantiisoli]GCF06752.1 hypothetical protein KDI_03160 [Dictyobacter arantiisoli]